MEKIYIFTGGTINKIAPHMAISAPAYGEVGRNIFKRLSSYDGYKVVLLPTTMAFHTISSSKSQVKQYEHICKKAGVTKIETNDDVRKVVDFLISKKSTRCIIMSSALADFKMESTEEFSEGEKTRDLNVSDHFINERLSSKNQYKITLSPSEKIINNIRTERKDIFLVSFKTTFQETANSTFKKGLEQLKRTSSNLVFANDIGFKTNMIITPEEFPYVVSSREEAIKKLCFMINSRLHLTFKRTEMIEGKNADINTLVNGGCIPKNFVEVLQSCIDMGVFKEFRGKTAGHFGCKVVGQKYERLSSVRKVNHNNVFTEGMSKIFPKDDGVIMAEGSKPSVGEHTQGYIYDRLKEEVDSIIHFHCPMKSDSKLSKYTRPQIGLECGSTACALNTSSGMHELQKGLWVVHLEGHGPNIAFSKDIPSEVVVNLIKENWDTSKRIAEEAIPDLEMA